MVPSAALLGKQTHWSPRIATVQCSGEQNTRCATQIMSSGHKGHKGQYHDNTVDSSDIVDSGHSVDSGQDNS